MSKLLRAAWLIAVVGCSSDDEASSEPADAGTRQTENAARSDNGGTDRPSPAGRAARTETRRDAGATVMDASVRAAPPREERARPGERARARAEGPAPQLEQEDAGMEPLPSCLPFQLPVDGSQTASATSPLWRRQQ